MAVNPELVQSRLAFISGEVAALEQLVESFSVDEFSADPWRVKGVKYSLQTVIEAMIDVAYHVCAKAFARAPQDAHEALLCLAEHGVIAREHLPIFREMVHFRNRVVHGYQRVDDDRVYRIVKDHRADFRAFVMALTRYLQTSAPGE